MQSTFRVGHETVSPGSLYGIQAPELKVAMDEAYDYKIGANEFDPDIVFPEVLTLSNQISTILQQLTPAQEAKFEEHILHCLSSMIYGSNMIERVGGDSDITLKLCMAIFNGEELPEDIGETEEEFLELKERSSYPATCQQILPPFCAVAVKLCNMPRRPPTSSVNLT